jgi:hypothetical protein
MSRGKQENHIVNNSNHVATECLENHFKKVVVEKETLTVTTALFESVAEYDFVFVDDGKFCGISQDLVDQIDEWEEKIKRRSVHCLKRSNALHLSPWIGIHRVLVNLSEWG